MKQRCNSIPKLRTVFFVAGSMLFLLFVSFSTPCKAREGQQSSQHEDNQAHWGYNVDDGPSHWAKLDPDWILCAEGRHQSPIDLAGATVATLAEMELRFPVANVTIVHQTHVLDVLDNGHTIQINYDRGETFTIGGESYKLRQYHFHSPSEHTVNGRHYPIEMHLVHTTNDKKLAVIGVFIEEGRHNAAFDAVWENLPQKPGHEVHLEDVQVDIDDMLPKDRSTYRYNGSLTTPPCSEGVRWFVFVKPIQMSGRQISAFQGIFYGNNRPTQPRNERTLLYDDIGVEAKQ